MARRWAEHKAAEQLLGPLGTASPALPQEDSKERPRLSGINQTP